MVLVKSIMALRNDRGRNAKIVPEADIDDGWDFGRYCRDMIKNSST